VERVGRKVAWRLLLLGVALTAAGLVLGLVLDERDDVGLVATTVIGIGSSIVATVIVARIVTRSIKGISFEDVLDALAGSSPIHREEQRIDLTIEQVDGLVEVSAEHTFTGVPSRRWRAFEFRMTSSLARWGTSGGVTEALGPWPTHGDGGIAPEVKERVRTKRAERFVIRSFGRFRERDAFTWTIDHISTDLVVEITCAAELAASLTYRVSHHRATEIETKAKHPDNDRYLPPSGRRRITITFEGGTLPYQGFEVRWDGAED
jgi:hypothetical protein